MAKSWRAKSCSPKAAMILPFMILPFCWFAPAAQPADWDAALKNIATYQEGRSRAGLIAVENLVRTAGLTDRAALEQRLIALLKSDATIECKRFVCRQLALIGSAASVPTLAALLNDAELADMARFALEPIPEPAVDHALIRALGKSTGKHRIGIINSLGARRTVPAASSLSWFVTSPDETLARTAVSALEKIHTAAALDALRTTQARARASVRPHIANCALTLAHALLARGEKLPAEKAFIAFYQMSQPPTVRTAALKGLLAADAAKHSPLVLAILRSDGDALQPLAADLVRTLPSITEVVGNLPKYSPRVQALVLAALAQRGDAAALPAVLAAAKSTDEAVAAAAFRAIGSLGGSAQVPLLVCAGNPVACDALIRLRGAEVNAAILQAAADQSPKTQADLIGILAARNAVSAVPTLLEMARSSTPETRTAALQAIGLLAGEAHLPALVKLVVENEGAENALTAAVTRLEDASKWSQAIVEQYPKAAVPNRCALLRVLRFSGDAKALALVRAELKSGDETLRDAALRAMAEWSNSDPADNLLKLAREGANTTERVLAFRGLVRMGEQTAKTSAEAGVKLLRRALDAAPRVEDKRLVLGALAGIGRRDALEMALGCLDNPKLGNEAGSAALKISAAICDKQPDVARKAAEKVLAVSKNDRLKKQAQALLGKSSRVTP